MTIPDIYWPVEEPDDSVSLQLRHPIEGQIVQVAGGIAQYRNETFYTGMSTPIFTRPIIWTVLWWKPYEMRAKDNI